MIACYLPKDEDSHAQSCTALSLPTHNLPHHIRIPGGDLQGNWTGPKTKDANIRKLSHAKRKGPTSPTSKSRHITENTTCIDHLAIWDPHKLAHQIGPTTTVESALLDDNGVLGKISLPILIPPAKPAPTATRHPPPPGPDVSISSPRY